MKVLYVTQEYAPLFAEGGLGVVSGALPRALCVDYGISHDIVLPYYPHLVRRLGLRTQEVAHLHSREVAGIRSDATVHRLLDHDSPCSVYLIRADTWYDRPGIYCDEAYRPFADHAERAAFFGGCVADWVTGNGQPYDLVHGTEWQSGAAMAHLRHRYPALPQLMSVFNAFYQGPLTDTSPDQLGLPSEMARKLAGDRTGRSRSLLAALWSANAAATCSRGYADELLAPTSDPESARRVGYAEGLLMPGGDDQVAVALRDLKIVGIQQGVDMGLWDPEATGRSTVPFSTDTVDTGKQANKGALQRRLGLRDDASVPLLGVCSRLVPEKGTDLLLSAVEPLLAEQRLQLVLVGPATTELQGEIRRLTLATPGYVAHVPRYDQDIAWLTFAASDLTAMPSRTEPGGLPPLIAYRYGTLPVVTKVGGLRDTVTDVRSDHAGGSGFQIPDRTVDAVHTTIVEALAWLADGGSRLTATRRRVMGLQWSWSDAAKGYADLYRRLCAEG
ncbi:glycogen synthase [Catellatospora methionotrophica]|uniref:glycogen synthase n=1 Tax=Catellatospora methionotrophica TaxID=121620 RepID=UPI0033D2365D